MTYMNRDDDDDECPSCGSTLTRDAEDETVCASECRGSSRPDPRDQDAGLEFLVKVARANGLHTGKAAREFLLNLPLQSSERAGGETTGRSVTKKRYRL